MSVHAARRRRLLAEVACGGVLVVDPIDVRYLTGLASSNVALLILSDRSVLVTDGRYETAAKSLNDELDVVIARDVVANAVIYVPSGAFIAFDSARTNVEVFGQLSEWSIWWEARPRMTASMRAVKDESECELLRTACQITAAAMMRAFECARPGMTERQIAGVFEASIRDLGADGPSFPTIVASGPNSARPHHEPSERELQRGDLLLIDAGALLEGYHADMTRTAVMGKASSWQRETHEIVATAQKLGRERMRAGATDVDATVQAYILEATGAPMAHGTGHGIGLQIHEAPMMTATSPYTIPGGAAMTVEPGVYLPGQGGVRIEDAGLVTATGYEVWTHLPYDLLELGEEHTWQPRMT